MAGFIRQAIHIVFAIVLFHVFVVLVLTLMFLAAIGAIYLVIEMFSHFSIIVV